MILILVLLMFMFFDLAVVFLAIGKLIDILEEG